MTQKSMRLAEEGFQMQSSDTSYQSIEARGEIEWSISQAFILMLEKSLDRIIKL